MVNRTSNPRRSRGLDRSAIVGAARRIADAEGIAALTLRRVAAELGTGQASLYRHISDRADLLDMLAEDLAGGIPIVEPHGTPAEAAARQWQAMHDHLAAHPWGVRLIAEGVHIARAADPVRRHCHELLTATGLPPDDAARAYRAAWHLLLGHLLNAHPLGHGTAEPPAEEFTWALRRLLTGIVAERG